DGREAPELLRVVPAVDPLDVPTHGPAVQLPQEGALGLCGRPQAQRYPVVLRPPHCRGCSSTRVPPALDPDVVRKRARLFGRGGGPLGARATRGRCTTGPAWRRARRGALERAADWG